MRTSYANRPEPAGSKSSGRSRKLAASKKVAHFKYASLTAQKVCLAGTFNDWRPGADEMNDLGNGRWAKDLTLEPGIYEYRLVVDGSWMLDPNADHVVINSFGDKNSLLTVA